MNPNIEELISEVKGFVGEEEKNTKNIEKLKVLSDYLQDQGHTQGELISLSLELNSLSEKIREIRQRKDTIENTIIKDFEVHLQKPEIVNGIIAYSMSLEDLCACNIAQINDKYICSFLLYSPATPDLVGCTQTNYITALCLQCVTDGQADISPQLNFPNLKKLYFYGHRISTHAAAETICNANFTNGLEYLRIEASNVPEYYRAFPEVVARTEKFKSLKGLKISNLTPPVVYAITMSPYLSDDVKKNCLGI